MSEPTVREALAKAMVENQGDKPDVDAKVEDTVIQDAPAKSADTEVVDKKLDDSADKPAADKSDDKAVADKPDDKPADKPADKPDVKADAKPDVKADAKTDVKTDAKPDVKTEKKDLPEGFTAPTSWRAPVREKFWNKLPAEVQVEVLRREKEVQGILKDSSMFKVTHDSVTKMVSDFKDVFSRETTTPAVTMQNLLNVVRTLQTAPPGIKAQHMASLITTFGVDVAMLDTALSAMVQNGVTGQPKAGDEVREILRSELQPVREFMGSMRQRAEQATAKSAGELQAEIEKFAQDPGNKYFDLVAEDMADLMDLASARGQKLSLPDAYQRAIMTRSDIAGQIAREKLEEAAGKRSDAADKAKQKAGLSTTGAPVGGGLPSGEVPTIREALVAAMSQK